MASPGFDARKSDIARWGGACVAVTVVLLAEVRICGCTVRVDTFSGRSDEDVQRFRTEQRDKLAGVTS